jgi:acetyl-CoA carboxylase carboxyltransferase component
MFEVDDVIDPADTRVWITRTLGEVPSRPPDGKRRPFVDTW